MPCIAFYLHCILHCYNWVYFDLRRVEKGMPPPPTSSVAEESTDGGANDSDNNNVVVEGAAAAVAMHGAKVTLAKKTESEQKLLSNLQKMYVV